MSFVRHCGDGLFLALNWRARPGESTILRLTCSARKSSEVDKGAKQYKPSTLANAALVAGRHEASTFCLDGLAESAKWRLLQIHTGKGLPKPIYGRVDLDPGAISASGIVEERDWKPNRHVNLVGWDASSKAARIVQAQKVLKNSRTHLNPARENGE